MIDPKILEQYPASLRININDDKAGFILNGLFAWGNDAYTLQYEFQQSYQNRIDAAMKTARTRFFASSDAWLKVTKLRQQLEQANRVVAATAQLLADAQAEYSRLLSEGDPASLLPTLTQRQTEAEASRKARDHFEKETENAEVAARGELVKTLHNALLTLQNGARSEYREGVTALVQSIDPKTLMELAVAEKLALMQAGGWSTTYANTTAAAPMEIQNYLAMPPRESAAVESDAKR